MPMRRTILISLVMAGLVVVPIALSQKTSQAELRFEEAHRKETIDGDLKAAIDLYRRAIDEAGSNRAIAAQALVRMGQCYENLGDTEARKAYERVVREFGDQKISAEAARARLAVLGSSGKEPRARRILADASGVSGTLFPGGKYISHTDRKTGDVLHYEIATGETKRITNRGTWTDSGAPADADEAFSRDGKQIAYSWDAKDGSYQLRVRNLDGSGLRTVFSDKEYVLIEPLDWAPDGQAILAFRTRDTTELALFPTRGGEVRVLKGLISAWPAWPHRAAFSPDGRYVALSYPGDAAPRGELLLMTANGRNQTVVAGHPAEDQMLGWTPDGRSLVFLSDRSGTWDIWSVRVSEGQQQGEAELLRKDFGGGEVLGFAPDGSCYYRTTLNVGHLYTGEVDLTTGRVLAPPVRVPTRYLGFIDQTRWSPDGKSLLYVSQRGPIGPQYNILTIRSAATGEERFLAPRLRFINQTSWAPDSRSILAIGIGALESAIFRMDAESGEASRLVGGDRFVPRLCPDGKTLLFVGNGPVLMRRNLDTGEELELAKEAWSYDVSPNGREVSFFSKGAVRITSISGGEPREVFRTSAEQCRPRWTADGRAMIVEVHGKGNPEVWEVPAQGGTPRKLEVSVSGLESFTLHPDNRRFAFAVNEPAKSEFWVLENFLAAKESRTVAVAK